MRTNQKNGGAAVPLLPEAQSAINGDDKEEVPEGASISSAVFNISTSMIGAGIMSIPATFKVLGVIPSFIVILILAFFVDVTVEFLLKYTRHSGQLNSYGALLAESFGKPGAVALQVCVVVTNLGALIIYLIIIGDVLSGSEAGRTVHLGVLQEWFGIHWWNSRAFALLFIILFIMLPLVALKRIDSLRHASAVSILLAVLFVLICSAMAIKAMLEGKTKKIRLLPDISHGISAIDLFTTIPVIATAFGCHVNGFWQVLLDPESQLLTAFTCPSGHYQWCVVPFGLKQAPALFQRHMQNAFRNLEKFTCIYVDDILVLSNTKKEHYLHVGMVLKKCEELGIILSEKKAQLFKNKINFLGLEIDQGYHCHQNHILEHIHKFPDRIEDKKQLQRFLGVLTYAESYIPKLAEIRKPLQVKLKEDVVWNWKDSDTDHVHKIKKNLKSFPKLYHPLPEDKLIIETDASDEFWGGILKAKNKDQELICRYTSGSFKKAELNYHSNEKEYLAVIQVIKKFSAYLTPIRFLVRTDNKNFTYFLKINLKGDNKQGKLVRWQMWLSRYCFDVEHIAGNKNIFADCLTREFAG